ncbi:phosphate starvation-inducible protein PhoH, predicted ATPase [Halobacteroides halobius DSM 5150]|uniref:PhoH-like protein n=1 Tax=Halobacteroides halobius (strain ATCC 35273 / DSM 5150 / MD-1) TaxID=748449 RepID=L0KBS1_HALHC|nr:PhoH family protein [Halobacteroides halobius]AGB41799.1 phosphate starvation-inducible protein PhoH, predicted ATPase [Halobacteroides halobius DSM 5150]
MEELTKELELSNNHSAISIFGNQDKTLELIEEDLDVEIIARGNLIKATGAEKSVDRVLDLFQQLDEVVKEKGSLTSQEIEYAIELIKEDKFSLQEIYSDIIQVTSSGQKIRPKTLGQKIYVDAIRQDDIVFGVGPAGTGKTFLAVVMAVNALMSNQVKRIILTRPAIEAGENLGFLPGDLQEKVDPYLRPVYDSLYEVLGTGKVEQLLEKKVIEIAPLAYMRGRTLKDSFVILDEAQNTTREQMKMFLTRLGRNSQAVINGDITQVDLPHKKRSGLVQAKEILEKIKGINFVYLTNRDVVRHRLVKEIIAAYKALE